MTSEFITQLADLIDRWDTLSKAAAERIDTADQAVQGDFYAGLLFGIDIARDELIAALAQAMTETAKTSTGMMKSAGQLPN